MDPAQIRITDHSGRVITESKRIDSNYVASQTNIQNLYLARKNSYKNKTEFQSKLKVLFNNGFQSEIYQRISTDTATIKCSCDPFDNTLMIPKNASHMVNSQQ